MAVKSFDFAARRAQESANAKGGRTPAKKKDHPFTLESGGTVYHARAEIEDDSLGMASGLFVRAERDEDPADMYEAFEDTLRNLFVPATAKALLRRVKNPDDSLRIGDLTEVIEWAMSLHTGGRPTTSPRT